MAEETAVSKRSLEFHVPYAEFEAEAGRVAAELQKKVRLPGFRPGKVPVPVIRKRFEAEVRQEAVETLVDRVFRERADREGLKIVGNPNVKDLHFHPGEELHFTAEFEVAPEFELGEYTELEAPYEEPVVTDEDVAARLEKLRLDKAEYVNIDPRPVESGDHAVVSLRSIAGVEGKPVESDEMILEVGGADTFPEYTDALMGMSPGEEAEVTIEYPENYVHEQLAGRTVTFHLELKGLRRKELPDLNDDFAKDLGDFQSLEELSAEVRRGLLRDREFVAKQMATNHIVERLIDSHDFAVPEAWVDQQIRNNVEARMNELVAQGVPTEQLKQIKLNWEELRETQGEKAARDVRASLLLSRIAERESITAYQDDVDKEVQRIARNARQPVAAVRMKLEKDGGLGRIANRIVTDKVLNYLFEQARKVTPEKALESSGDGEEE